MLEVGASYNVKDKSKESLEILLKKYETDNSDLELLMNIFYAYNEAGKYQQGLRYLQRAYNKAMELYDLNPSNLELLLKMSEMLKLVNRIEDIKSLWEAYTKRNPQVVQGWINLASIQLQENDFKSFKFSLEKVGTLNPNSSEFTAIALNYLSQKQMIDNMVDTSFILNSNKILKNSNSIFLSLSTITIRFQEQLANNLSDFEGPINFSIKLSEIDSIELNKAEESISNLLKIDSLKSNHALLKALLMKKILDSKFEEAVALYEEINKTNHRDADIYRILSFGYLLRNDFNNSIASLKDSYKCSLEAKDLILIAKLYFYNNQSKEAISIFENLMMSDPNKIEFAYGIIASQLKNKNFSEACSSLFRFEELYLKEKNLDSDEVYLFLKSVCIIAFSKNRDEVLNSINLTISKTNKLRSKAEKLKQLFIN
jgi:tetratricopeptide (TPR) repeat protein